MSTLTFTGSAQTRKRKSDYDIWIEQGNSGTEADYELALHGYTSAQVMLMKKFNSAPTQTYKQEGGSDITYTFETGTVTFSGSDAGWSPTPPTGTGDLYVIYASAVSKDTTDVIEADEWTFPVILSTAGTPGQNGRNVTTVFAFKASPTQPSAPTGTITYNFTDGTITGLDASGWSKNVPNGDKVWVSISTASSLTTTATLSSWSTPEVFKEKGDAGISITGTTDLYAVNNSDTTAPTYPDDYDDFDDVVGDLDADHRFLWNIEIVSYSDGSSDELTPHIIYRYSTDGTNATQIKTIEEQYAYGTSSQATGTWTPAPLTPDSTHQYVWQRERVVFDTTPETYGTWTTEHMIAMYIKGSDGTPAKVFKIGINRETYKRNLRVSSNNPAITLTANIQGMTETAYWFVDHGTLSASSGSPVTLTIPYINDYDTVTIRMGNHNTWAGSDADKKDEIIISVIDETEFNHDFGAVTSLPSTFVDKDGNTCQSMNGDFFVASDNFNDDAYVKGIPYKKELGVWNSFTGDNTENANRMLSLLGSVMSSRITVPSTSAFYGWFATLTAQIAILNNLFVKNINIGDGDGTADSGFGFKVHAFDENGNPLPEILFDITYDDKHLMTIDTTNGTVTMMNTNITGDFTSEGRFETQKTSSPHPLNVSCTTANLWSSYSFFGYLVGLLNTYHTHLDSNRCFWYNTASGTLYLIDGNTGNFISKSFARVGVYGFSDSYFTTYDTSYPFGSNYDRFASVYYCYKNSSKNAIIFVDSSHAGNQSVAANQCAANIFGELSSFRDYTATPLLPYRYYVSSSNNSSISYGGSTVWTSSANLTGYYYNISSLALDTTYKAFTGTVTINGSVVVNATSDNKYYIKKGDEDYIKIANPSQTPVYTIYDENDKSWALNLSVEAGVEGIKAKNVMPYDSSAKVGTNALPFAEGNFVKIVNSQNSNSTVWGAVFN